GSVGLAHHPGGLADRETLDEPEHHALALLVTELLHRGHEVLGRQRAEYGFLRARLAVFALEGVCGGDLEAMSRGFHVVEDDVARNGDEPGADVASLVTDGADATQGTQE